MKRNFQHIFPPDFPWRPHHPPARSASSRAPVPPGAPGTTALPRRGAPRGSRRSRPSASPWPRWRFGASGWVLGILKNAGKLGGFHMIPWVEILRQLCFWMIDYPPKVSSHLLLADIYWSGVDIKGQSHVCKTLTVTRQFWVIVHLSPGWSRTPRSG